MLVSIPTGTLFVIRRVGVGVIRVNCGDRADRPLYAERGTDMSRFVVLTGLLLILSQAAVLPGPVDPVGPLAQSFFPDEDDDRPELFLPEEGDSDPSNFYPEEGDSDPSNFYPEEGDSDPANFASPDLDELA